mgnify:CR=1 FL=1
MYKFTQAEFDNVVQTAFLSVNPPILKRFPGKEKRKFMTLFLIIRQFSQARTYSEAEVNHILKPIHDDYVTLRRYLCDYGFLDRRQDGSAYWVVADDFPECHL